MSDDSDAVGLSSPSLAEVEDPISKESKRLRRHLGLGDTPDMPPSNPPPDVMPLFLIERAPGSRNGSKCKLSSCSKRIMPGQYRVVLKPAMSAPDWLRSSSQTSDYYHVSCLEEIADLSQPDLLGRIVPVTRNTFGLRNIRGSGILEGNYLCDGGAERLILEWKVQRDRWIDEQLDPAFENLLRNAGSSTFTYQKVTNIKEHEELLLQTSLAPFESDGPDDTAEWNLFDSFLKPRDGRENLNDRHNISTMLRRWKHGVKLATLDEKDEPLTDKQKQARTRLGEKAIRAITRLSAIPMPDLQSAFFGEKS